MKKFLFLGAFLLVSTISVLADEGKLATSCPTGCETTSTAKCCSTRSGDTYYGKLT